MFAGFKVMSFCQCSIQQTAYSLLLGYVINPLNVINLIACCPLNFLAMSNLGVEAFIFISSFFTAYRCLQIMEAKGGILTSKDVLKIYARKFLRIAPAYYVMWLLLWLLTYRGGSGPVWHLAYINMETCKDDWLLTLLMVGNMSSNLRPTAGCF